MNKEDFKNKIRGVKDTLKDTFNKDTGNKNVENTKTDMRNKTNTVKPDMNRKVS